VEDLLVQNIIFPRSEKHKEMKLALLKRLLPTKHATKIDPSKLSVQILLERNPLKRNFLRRNLLKGYPLKRNMYLK
jgi:hypothetical protein